MSEYPRRHHRAQDRRDLNGAASLHAPRRIDVGTPETTINAFADMTDLAQPVRATQRFFGLVDYIAEIDFLADEIMTGTVRLGENEWAIRGRPGREPVRRSASAIRHAGDRQISGDGGRIPRSRQPVGSGRQGDRRLRRALYPCAVLVQRSGAQTSEDITLTDAVDHLKAALPSCRRRTDIGTTTCCPHLQPAG